MATRVLVVDRAQGTRDAVAEALGELASEVVWAARDNALDRARAAGTAGQAFEVVLLEADPPPSPQLVRELTTLGARVVLASNGGDAHALAARCGAPTWSCARSRRRAIVSHRARGRRGAGRRCA